MGILMVVLFVAMTGCKGNKKAKKPYVKSTAEIKNGTTKAEGKDSEQSEVPLMVGCDSLGNNFNPFLAENGTDLQAVNLTQTKLFGTDRAGRLVEKGIDGELLSYHGEQYTYYGIADIKKTYKRKLGYTVYRITLRDDLIFSDGQPITIDDVIFSIYAFCDTDYKGPVTLGQSNIRGLLNYQADSARAEGYTEQQVEKYIKKKPEKLREWMKKHSESEENYRDKLYREARLQMAASSKKKGNPVNNIEGIKRLNDYEMRIYTTGYDNHFVEQLQIPVCPLHYYGNTAKYHFEDNQFGFAKGDLSAIQANKTTPMGAGAYRFVKYESGIAYYMANELYYQGCPNITYLHLKDLTKLFPDEELTAAKLAEEIQGGTIDIVLDTLEQSDVEAIGTINETGKLSDDVIQTRMIANAAYAYVGINPEQIKLGTDAASAESKALRQALATVFSACRGIAIEKTGSKLTLVNAPALKSSWLSPEQQQKDLIAYAKGSDSDKDIYKSDDSLEEKRGAAKEAALEWFAAAGYTVEDGKITAAPIGGALSFRMQLAGGPDSEGYLLATTAAADLQELGITIQIETVTPEHLSENLRRLREGLKPAKEPLQLWYAEESLKPEPELAKRFAYLQDAGLTQVLQQIEEMPDAQKRQETVQAAFETIQSYVTEIPAYQHRTAMLFSGERINEKTMTGDVTLFYDWAREVQNIEMKKKN